MDPSFRFAGGTVGSLLQNPLGGLAGISVERAGHRLEIEAVAFDAGSPRADWDCTAHWTLRVDDRVLEVGAGVSLGAELLYPAAPDATERCTEVLRSALDAQGEPDDELAEELMLALRHPIAPNIFAGWVRDRALAHLTVDGLVARVERGLRSMELTCEALELHPRTAVVKVLLRLTRRRGEEYDGVIEQESYLGRVDPSAFLEPAPPHDDPRFEELGRQWRKVLKSELARRAWVSDELPMPSDVVSDALGPGSIITLIGDWLVDGFPPPKPRAWRPSKAHVEAQSKKVRRLTHNELLSLPRGNRDVRAGYRLGQWDLLLAPGLKGAKLGADRILLAERGAAPVVLLRSDDETQNRLKYTIDGDAVAMRRCLLWLRTLLEAARIEDAFDIVWPYADEPEHRTVDEWLTFGHREHCFDWRRSFDSIEDDHPYWDAHDVYLKALSPAKQDRIRRRDIPMYYRFQRDLVDSKFLGKLEKPELIA